MWLGTAADFVVMGYRHFGSAFHEAIVFVHGNIKLTYLVIFCLSLRVPYPCIKKCFIPI